MHKIGKKDYRFTATGNETLRPFENSYMNTTRKAGIAGNSDAEIEKIVRAADHPSFNVSEIKTRTNLHEAVKRASIGFELVHGQDDREQILKASYPYNTICLLLITFGFQDAPVQGTGFFISKKCIITAGHCVYYQGNWASSVTVVPGAMGDFEPFGHSASSTFRSVEGWTSDQNSNFDYGAIILKSEDLYNRINATMGFMPSANEAIVEIAGYPDDKIARMPYTAGGPIHSRSKFRFFYDVDTEGGNSGSPVFIKDAAGIYAVGIHTDGDNPDNYGIRFRQEMMDRLNEWMQL